MSQLPTLPSPPRGRRCPECSLSCTPLNCGPVVVDRCGQCGGVWFDDKKIGVFREKLREFDLSQLVPESGASLPANTILPCPRCRGIVLEPFHYGVNTGVKPLRCPRCQGIWLGADQMRVFLEQARLAQQIAPDVRGMVAALTQQQKMLEKMRRRTWDWQQVLDWLVHWFR